MNKIKRNFFSIIFLLYCLCLLIFSTSNIISIKKGLYLWANSVIPSLFPFFIATELLMNTNLINFIGQKFNNFMHPIFNISGKGSFCLIMGLISGYPIGAKIASNYRKNNICSKEECEHLLSFTNNSGPLFIIGTIGISIFGNSTIGLLLLITHILSALTVGFIFKFWKYKKNIYNEHSLNQNNIYESKYISFSNLGELLQNSISSSISSILMIGGFIILFSSIISILNSSNFFKLFTIMLAPFSNFIHLPQDFICGIFTGLLEITNGINLIANIPIKNISYNIIITAFLLGNGGLSVFLQVFSIISKTDLSIKPYIYRENFTRFNCCSLYLHYYKYFSIF